MIKIIRYWIVRLVGVSKGEANALLILVPILLLVIVVPPFFNRYIVNVYSNHESDQVILDSLLSQLESHQESLIQVTPLTVFSKFDPNTSSSKALQSNGISEKIANRIINYRNKGGVFKEKKDLKKIYGFKEDLYEVLIPYIDITQIKSTIKSKSRVASQNKSWINFPDKATIRVFDINKADTSILKQISGIGDKLSFRITNFREKLGGFVTPSQLYSVYGLQIEVVDSLLKYGVISTDFIPTQININTDTVKQLSKHPYINYKLAKAIINFRVQHGDYKEVTELKKIHLINDSIYQIIYPYFKIIY